jgi:hypothetical protein
MQTKDLVLVRASIEHPFVLGQIQHHRFEPAPVRREARGGQTEWKRGIVTVRA